MSQKGGERPYKGRLGKDRRIGPKPPFLCEREIDPAHQESDPEVSVAADRRDDFALSKTLERGRVSVRPAAMKRLP